MLSGRIQRMLSLVTAAHLLHSNLSTTFADVQPFLIHSIHPQARLIAVVRNPIYCIRSEYYYFITHHCKVNDTEVKALCRTSQNCDKSFEWFQSVYERQKYSVCIRTETGLSQNHLAINYAWRLRCIISLCPSGSSTFQENMFSFFALKTWKLTRRVWRHRCMDLWAFLL